MTTGLERTIDGRVVRLPTISRRRRIPWLVALAGRLRLGNRHRHATSTATLDPPPRRRRRAAPRARDVYDDAIARGIASPF